MTTPSSLSLGLPSSVVTENTSATRPPFITLVTLPESIFSVGTKCRTLSLGVDNPLVRLSTYCVVCYFLGQRLPVLTKRIRVHGDGTEVFDFHPS